MREYKKYIWATILVSVLTILPAFYLHYKVPCSEADFWIDICLGIFAGAFLTLITSIISYNREKRRTLEGFLYHTSRILSYLNKYQESMSIEQKINFYLNYIELDKSEWDMEYGNMDFFFDPITKNRKYIYEKIYNPIVTFNKAVSIHMWHFRLNIDGCGKNDAAMKIFLSELQDYLITKEEYKYPIEFDDNKNVIEYGTSPYLKPKLVNDINEELNRHYLEIMYGKRVAKKLSKLQEEELNGQDENADGE